MTLYSDDKKEIVYKVKRRVTGVRCDVCKRIIPAGKWNREEPSKYFFVSTSHQLWGNDSIDSLDMKDICPECINKFMTDYISKANDTYELNVECTFCTSSEEWVNE